MEADHKQLAQLLPLLPVLAELGRTEHVTETAELLGVPQSTVSRALARASAVVGTELLVRDGRGVRLTPAARTLLPYIEQALAEFQAGLDLVRSESEVVRGRISLAFQHTFGEATLPLLISAFRGRHPGAVFTLSQGARNACLDELASGEADLALTAPVAPAGRNLQSAALYREPLRLVVHHSHPLAGRTTAALADIRTEPFVALGPGYGMRSLTDALFREAGYRPRIAFESQDSHTIRGLVSAGLGVSILPPGGDAPGRTVSPETGNLGWVEVPLDSALAFREVGLSWRRSKPDTEAVPVRLFREMVVAEGPHLLAGLVRQRTADRPAGRGNGYDGGGHAADYRRLRGQYPCDVTNTENPSAMPAEQPVASASGPLAGVVIGLDIGGTKTHGIRFEDGVPVADESAGSSNVQNVSRDEAARNIADLFARIGGGTVSQVYAGSGGIDTDEDAAALASLIQPHVPGARVTVVHDSRLLLAAGHASTGVAVIAGTGSAAWGRNADGGEARAGGWGYLLGDEGSGYWLGREAVRHSLRQMNQGQPADQLATALMESCGVDHPNRLIALFHSPDTGRRFWAQQARHVVAAAAGGHRASLDLLDRAGQDLADLALQVLNQLGISGPVILGGGLGMNVAPLQEAFRRHLESAGVTDVRVLDQEPVFGVLQLVAEPA